MRSEKYFRVSDASAPARVAVLRLCSSSTATRVTRASRLTPQTASAMSVMLPRPESGRSKNRANSIAIIFGVAAGRTRIATPVDHLDGLTELSERGGLARPCRAGNHQAAPPVVSVLVQLDQTAAGGDDLTDRGSLDYQQPGVVLDAVIVVAVPLVIGQGRPDRLGQQIRHCGHLGDEPAPARQGGQLQMLVLAGLPRAGRAGHHRLSASANGSKMGSGITFASGASCSAGPAAAAGCAGPPDSGWSCFPFGAEAALVRAATRRSRLLIFGFSWSCGPAFARRSSAATASAICSSVASRPRLRQAWSQASSPNGTGARSRCFQNTVVHPSGPRTWTRETS